MKHQYLQCVAHMMRLTAQLMVLKIGSEDQQFQRQQVTGCCPHQFANWSLMCLKNAIIFLEWAKLSLLAAGQMTAAVWVCVHVCERVCSKD